MTNKTLIKLAVSVSLACAGCESHSWADGGAMTARADEAATVKPVVKPVAPPKEEPKAKTDTRDKTKKVERAIDLDTKLTVTRLVIAHGVKDREPVDATEQFVEGEAERIYAFVEVGNPDAVDSAVFVSFVPDKGVERGPIELDVGASKRWRTWAYTRVANKPGIWHAVVRNAKGEEIARTRFEITSKDAAVEIKPIDPA